MLKNNWELKERQAWRKGVVSESIDLKWVHNVSLCCSQFKANNTTYLSHLTLKLELEFHLAFICFISFQTNYALNKNIDLLIA